MSSTLNIDKGTSAQQLEALINDAPKGAILEFGAGNYTFDDALSITRSDVTLKGAGSGKTTLTFTNQALDGDDGYAIQLNGSSSEKMGTLTQDAGEGEHRITLNGSHDLKPGDTLRLWQDNDSAFFDQIGDTSWRKDNAPLRTSMATVESIEGNTITLDRGVHFDFEGGKTQVERLDALSNVTLQGFDINFELGTPDNGSFENTLSNLKDFMAVSLEGTEGCKLEDIQVINGPSIAFHFAKTLDNAVNAIEAHGAFNKGTGGNGYAFELRESHDGTFTDLADSGMRHSLLFASWRSSVGNEAHIRSTDRDINFHGGRDHHNTVHVDQSVRGADNISTSLWINEGGVGWGAITDTESNQVTFDYVMGSRRDDTLQGSDDGVYFNGQLGSDTLLGGQGDDILQGGPGEDWGDDNLNGGVGSDTALFAQDYDAYEIVFEGDEAIVRGDGGNDTLIDIEKAIFADGTVLDLASGETSTGGSTEAPLAEAILNDLIATPDTDIVSHAEAEANDEANATVPVNTPDIPDDPDTVADTAATPSTPSQDVTASKPVEEALASVGEPAPTEDTLPDEPASSTASLSVTSNVRRAWNDGYVADVTVVNTSDSEIASPELYFDLPDDLARLWRGHVSESGDGFRVTNDDALAPGEAWNFGFRAENDGQVDMGEPAPLLGLETVQPDMLIQ